MIDCVIVFFMENNRKTSRFRDPYLVQKAAEHIKKLAPSHMVRFCHVCGTHEWTVAHYGIRSLLPESLDVISGPGCPVCVTPASDFDAIISLALKGVTVLSFGDVIRVPGSRLSLQESKAEGGDVRIVYGVGDAVRIARKEPKKEFVFFAIGFETTAPSTALEILNTPPKNLSFLISHKLIPPAMELLLGIGDLQIDGFIAPGHVSTIIGMNPYRIFPEAYSMPTVIAGFEPLDVLFSILMLLNQIKRGEAKLQNEYARSVSPEGNIKAQQILKQAFDVGSGHWRGLGRLPNSAFKMKKDFIHYNAREKYDLKIEDSRDLLPGCLCHLVMIGKIKPPGCSLFMKKCTPISPKGACMVSNEGTCSIWAKQMYRAPKNQPSHK
jgi:hydrogenase expression/formation protein HypD